MTHVDDMCVTRDASRHVLTSHYHRLQQPFVAKECTATLLLPVVSLDLYR